MEELREYVERNNTLPLAEASELMQVSEEQAVQLARDGLVRAEEKEDGLRFEAASTAAFAGEKSTQMAVDEARRLCPEMVETVQTLARIQQSRGLIAGKAEMADLFLEVAERIAAGSVEEDRGTVE